MSRDRNIELYRRLSTLYPRSFREEYGDDLVAAFAEYLRDERAATVWWSTVRDLVMTVPTQHLEARMHRPSTRTVKIAATTFTVAALLLAIVAGTGPVVGVFLLAAIAGLIATTLAWRTDRQTSRNGDRSAIRWRAFVAVGIALLGAVLVVINVPPYSRDELPEFGWVLMMLSLITGIALVTVGATAGIAQRSTRNSASR